MKEIIIRHLQRFEKTILMISMKIECNPSNIKTFNSKNKHSEIFELIQNLYLVSEFVL